MSQTEDRKLALIKAFCDGQWHSGEDLAQSLGLSRAAVWKRLKSLEVYGLQFESQAGKGYRLSQPLELLDEKRIQKQLSESQQAQLSDLIILTQTDSTNQYLSEHASQSQLQSPSVCFAEYQSAGRGRRGRQWQSPFGANLYCSFLWRFDEMPAELSTLSLAVGVAIVESLASLGVKGVGIKWPNDLLAEGRKVGGILIEHSGESGGPCRVIVGVGINYAMTDQQAKDVEQPWVSLQGLAQEKNTALPSRNALAGSLVSTLLDCLSEFSVTGFAGFRSRWSDHDVTQGQQVRIEQKGEWKQGEALGIDKDGAFLVRIRGERQRFVSGDVSLRVGPVK